LHFPTANFRDWHPDLAIHKTRGARSIAKDVLNLSRLQGQVANARRFSEEPRNT